uniref:Uncharacterized protein n=1 Tax=Anguilla anguilla TaxID=7936 RepID=A0A0E9VIJ1_ANGAN
MCQVRLPIVGRPALSPFFSFFIGCCCA